MPHAVKSSFVLFAASVVLSGQTPPADRWVRTGDLIEGRSNHTATLLQNGEVLIVGGTCGFDEYPVFCAAEAELYDPATRAFRKTGPLVHNRSGHWAVLLPDGRVLILGGYPSGRAPSPEIYDPTTARFTSTGLSGVEGPAVLLNDGRVLMAGDHSLVAYEPRSGTTTTIGLPFDLRSNYKSVTMTSLASGDVLIAGTFAGPGSGPARRFVSGFRFHPGDNSLTAVKESASASLEFHSATGLSDGRVLLAGGATEGYGFGTIDRVDVYDPRVDRVLPSALLLTERASHTATLLPDGAVLVAGGRVDNTKGHRPLSNVERFDPGTNRFLRAASLGTARANHTATLLQDGKILVAGGFEVNNNLATAELYEPANPIPAASLYARADGSGAILHAGTARLVTLDDPAEPGEVLEIYGTGLIDGSVIPPLVSIGGRAAEVLYFGKAPGYDSLNQINVRVPAGIPPGRAVGVRMNYLDRPSNEVTLVVR